MRVLLIALVAMLAAFAPPERGTRYLFEVGNAGGQAATVEAMRKRLEAAGIEASVEPQGPVRIEVRAAGTIAQERITGLLSRRGVMTFNRVNRTAYEEDFPVGEERDGLRSLANQPEDGKVLLIEADAIVTGSQIESARAEIDRSAGMPVIQIKLNPNGTRAFGVATSQNVGRQMAIVVDDKVLLAPVVAAPIPYGLVTITGSFTMAEAQDYAAAVRAPLPGPMKLIEIGTYGPAQ